MTETGTADARAGISAEPSALDRLVVDHARQALALAGLVWNHAVSEYASDLGVIMPTIIPEPRQVLYAAGKGRDLMAFDAHDQVASYYRGNYERIRVHDWRPATELRARWYVFFEGCVRYTNLASGVPENHNTIVLFPMDDSREGIQGELAWTRQPTGEREAADLPGVPAEVATADINRSMVLDWIEALKGGDARAVAAFFTDDARQAARDYGTDSQGYRALAGADIERFYARLFDRFDVAGVDIIQLAVKDWYAFAELHWQVREKATGKGWRMNTVDMMPIMAPGKFLARIGWGTQPVAD